MWSVGGVHSTGVGILFGERDFFVENVYTIVQGRVVAADVNFRGLKFRVVGAYGPQTAAERREMVDSMAPLMVTNRQLIVGGDFNAVLDGSGDASADYVCTVQTKSLDTPSHSMSFLSFHDY